jgi:hypothetical protein
MTQSSAPAAGVEACCMAPISGVVLEGVDMAAYGLDKMIDGPCRRREEGCRG